MNEDDRNKGLEGFGEFIEEVYTTDAEREQRIALGEKITKKMSTTLERDFMKRFLVHTPKEQDEIARRITQFFPLRWRFARPDQIVAEWEAFCEHYDLPNNKKLRIKLVGNYE